MDVDHYHYFTHDIPEPGWDTNGIAVQMGLDGIPYAGSMCLPDRKQRTAISEFSGPGNEWNERKLQTALVFTIKE